jgi:hypothetical protein
MLIRRISMSSSGETADVQMRVDVPVAPPEFRAALREHRLITAGALQRRLLRHRPEFAAGTSRTYTKRPPAIPRRVLMPARHRQIAPPAVSAARRRHRHVISTVGKQMNFRRRRVRRGENPQRALRLRRLRPGLGHFQRMGYSDERLGNPLMQQQLRRAERRLGVKARCIG